MNLPEEAPKLAKLPFFVGDGILLATAFLIARATPAPLGPGPLLAITLCVAFGSALAVIPFLVDYARRQDALLTERQNQLEALARTTAESAEQLSIAASSLHGIAESSARNLKLAEQLPHKLQERIQDLRQQLAEISSAETDALQQEVNTLRAAEAEKLDAAVDKIARLVADLGKLEASTAATLDKFPALAAQASAELTQAVARVRTDLEKRLKSAAKPAPAAPPPENAPPPPPPAAEPAAESPPAPVAEAVPDAPAPEPEVEPTPPPAPPVAADPEPRTEDASPPRPRKSRAPAEPEPEFELPAGESPAGGVAPSADGATRLIATAYIGIGNKLFIRGDGPGLSWDKGVPLQFISIGKWRWETPDAPAPITVKLYKNDQIECTALGALTLEPGKQHEVNAGF